MTSFNIKNYYQIKTGTDSLSDNTWYVNDSLNHSYILYSDFDAIDEIENKIRAQPPEESVLNIQDFSEYANTIFTPYNNATPDNPLIGNFEFYKTKINDDPYSLQNNILLDLDDRIITFVVDNSGSMTWNDANKFRYDIIKSIINRLSVTYPSNISYNLLSFGGIPIKVNIVTFEDEQPDDNLSPDAIISTQMSLENEVAGIRVVRNENHYPNSPIDGVVIKDGLFDNIADRGLNTGQTYYYGIYTYDSNYKFSEGSFIQATPQDNIIPRGISNARVATLIGTGPVSDDYTLSLWHFNENNISFFGRSIEDDNIVYDFSGSNLHLYTQDVQVDSSYYNPSGSHYVRMNGDDSYVYREDLNSNLTFNNSYLSYMGWFSIAQYGTNSGRVLFSRSDATNIDYIAVVNQSGLIGFSLDGVNFVFSDTGISLQEWNHIAITVDLSLSNDHVKFYINGDLVGERTLINTSYNSSSMYFDIGRTRFASTYDTLLGKISDFSIHDTIRDNSYISKYSEDMSYNSKVEAQNIVASQSSTSIQDNGDRINVIKYRVSSSYDFPGGKVKIIGKNYYEPTHIDDGELIIELNAVPGDHTVVNKIEYMPLSTFYYKIYSQNILGNYSYNDDSPTLPVDIPFMSNESYKELEDPIPFLPPVQSENIIVGDTINYIYWNEIVDTRIQGIRIYVSNDNYPTIALDGEGDKSNGELIFEGTTSDTEFIHRNLENDVLKYYSIITVNRFGQVSQPVNLQGIPSSSNNNTLIPLEDVRGLNYEIINDEDIVLKWDSIFGLNQNIETYFGNQVYIYAYVTNIFGESLNYNSNITLDLDVTINRSSTEQEDVFESSDTVFADDESYNFYVTSQNNGIVKAVFSAVDNQNILRNIDSIEASVYVYANVPNSNFDSASSPSLSNPKYLFQYRSESIFIKMNNPLEMNLINEKGYEISKKCKSSVGGDAALDAVAGDLLEFTKTFDGLVSTSNKSFVLRSEIQYEKEDIDINDLSIETIIYDLPSHDLCKEFVFDIDSLSESEDVIITNNIEILQGTSADSVTGLEKEFSYFDLFISTPNSPKSVYCYVKISYLNYISVQRMYILFDSPLKLELQADAPIANGSDIAQQIATVGFFDNASDSYLPVSDGVVVQWQLIPKEGGQNRPFYSTEVVPNRVNGIFSTTKNGTAKNVYFGPVSDVSVTSNAESLIEDNTAGAIPSSSLVTTSSSTTDISQVEIYIGETYTIKAYASVNGVDVSAEEDVLIEPLDKRLNKQLFLMSMAEMANEIWADGSDYAKLSIAKNYNTSNQSFSNCFRKCVLENDWTTYVLSDDQQIEISVGKGYEIIWGDVTEVIDPYTGAKELSLGKNSFTSTDSAIVGLDKNGNITNVYFRLNQEIPVEKEEETNGGDTLGLISDLLNTKPKSLCECLGDLSDIQTDAEYEGVVIGRTSVIDGLNSVSLRGGGDADSGIPPVIIQPKEPLQVDFLGILLDDNSITNNLITDGSTYNKFLFLVSFAGQNVPDGTPITCEVVSALEQTNISFVSSVVYTQSQFIDSYDANNAYSYAVLTLQPIGDNEILNDVIVASSTYDKKGNISRKKGVCIKIDKQVEKVKLEDDESSQSSVVSDNVLTYNINDDTWAELKNVNTPRTNLTLEYYPDKLYAIGGISSQGTSNKLEIYDIASDSWSYGATMNSRRFSHQSVIIDQYIYVLGGVSFDQKNGFSILASVERYDIANDEWTTLSDMPVGCAFGSAVYMDNGSTQRIYVLSGISKINSQNANVENFNDYILYLDINTLSWGSKQVTNQGLLYIYRKIGCGAFTKNNNIIVFSGASQDVNNLDKKVISQTLKNTLDSYILDTTNLSLGIYSNFGEFPSPRNTFGYTVYGNNCYILGGQNDESRYTNIFESINILSNPISLIGSLTSIENGLSKFGMNSFVYAGINANGYNYNSDPHIVVVGGNYSGKTNDYLNIDTEILPKKMRLQGKENVDILVNLTDTSGNKPNHEITLYVRGFLRNTSSESEREQSNTIVDTEDINLYPVIFEEYITSTYNNGQAIITLKPRSEDILNSIEDLEERASIDIGDNISDNLDEDFKYSFLSIKENEIRTPYSISVEINVSDDYYFGKTRDSIPLSSTTDEESPGGIAEDNYEISEIDISDYEQICTGETQDLSFDETEAKTSINSDILNRVSEIRDSFESSSYDSTPDIFSLVSGPTPDSLNPLIPCYNDDTWLPEINKILYNSNSDYNSMLKKINLLSDATPYGASALFDSLVEASGVLLNDNDTKSLNTLYVFTDNESNMSINSIDDVISAVNSTNADLTTPIIIGNISTAYPLTLSAKANISDTSDINKISSETGGQAITILSENYLDELVNIFVGSAIGSMGYGTFTFTIDFGEIILLDDIQFIFDLFENTNSIIEIWISEDGYQYTKIDDNFTGNKTVDFVGLKIRSIKIKITIITGFSLGNDSEYGIIPIGSIPSFDGFILTYGIIRKLYIYLNKEITAASPLQVVLSTSDNSIYDTNINFGFTTTDTHNWQDYNRNISMAKQTHNRSVVAYREVTETPTYEKLIPIDRYVYKMELGPLDLGSEVSVYEKQDNSNDTLIDSSEYKVIYRQGYIVFHNRHSNDLYMTITRSNQINIALQLINESMDNPLTVDSIGFLYNTNIDELPAPEAIKPEISNIQITTEPLVYDKISVTYDYYDANFEVEDITNRVIKWYVNGSRIPYLDGLTEWNDINNLNDILYKKVFSFAYDDSVNMIRKAMRKGESILKPGDEVFCIVQVSDGNMLSDPVKSNVAEVYSNNPFIENVVIYGEAEDGVGHRNVVSSDNIILKYDFYSDNNIDESKVTWFLNGEELLTQDSDNTGKFVLSNDGSSVGLTTFLNNNEIQAVLQPISLGVNGSTISSNLVIIGNSKPKIENAKITPSIPNSKQDLNLEYDFIDWDIDTLGDPSQYNNTSIKWYKQSSRSTPWEEIVVLEDEIIVPASYLSSGEKWKAILIPNDGLDNGDEVETDYVYIKN